MRVLMLLLLITGATAHSGEGLIGTDPADDAQFLLAPGVDNPADTFDAKRVDIGNIHFLGGDNSVSVMLDIGIHPSGTSGYMYYVGFNVAGNDYFTCWAVQYTSNNAAATQENVLGCSRFTSGTQVGPSLRADGVVLVNQTDGSTSVTWPLSRGEIGNPGDSTPITNITGTTWVRGISDCCAGSTTQTQYIWNQADRAPDNGAWNGTLATNSGGPSNETPPAPLVATPYISSSFEFSHEAGKNASYLVSYTLNRAPDTAGDVLFEFANMPTGWSASFKPAVLPYGPGTDASDTVAKVSVPADASGSGNYTIIAFLDGVETGSLQVPYNFGGEENTPDPNEKQDGKKSPGVGPALLLLALVAFAMTRRK